MLFSLLLRSLPNWHWSFRYLRLITRWWNCKVARLNSCRFLKCCYVSPGVYLTSERAPLRWRLIRKALINLRAPDISCLFIIARSKKSVGSEFPPILFSCYWISLLHVIYLSSDQWESTHDVGTNSESSYQLLCLAPGLTFTFYLTSNSWLSCLSETHNFREWDSFNSSPELRRHFTLCLLLPGQWEINERARIRMLIWKALISSLLLISYVSFLSSPSLR